MFAVAILKATNPFFDCMALFYTGGLSAIAFQYFRDSSYRSSITLLCIVVSLAAPAIFYATNGHQNAAAIALFLVLYVPFLLYATAGHFVVPSIARNLIQAAGGMTYSIYLLHFPIQLMIVLYFNAIQEPIPRESGLFFLGFMGLTLIASYVSYRLFELPAQALIRRKMI